MAIRMEKDEPRGPRPGGSGGDRRGGGSLLWVLLGLLLVFKRPKLLIPLLIVGAVWYFFLGGQELLGGFANEYDDGGTPAFSLGAALNEERFAQSEVFEPLALGSMNLLPARVSLESQAPRRLHQGRQGSCVGWAAAYAARTILQAGASGKNPNDVAFSPSYLYNQIHLDGCEGAYMHDAMQTMMQNGALPFSQFRYDESSCANYPDGQAIALGQQFRIKGFNRLTLGARNLKPDIQGIKQHLAQGAPVVIGMMVGGTFMSRMVGQKVWRPTQQDYAMPGYGGHAMCVIGYDDNVDGGAFHIMNSWGEDWGDRGNAWVRYRDFEHFVKEAYGLYPMGNTQQLDPNKLAAEFALFDNEKQAFIGLRQVADIAFRTLRPLRPGDKFKIAIANSIECYVYVFGQEADGSSYVLFPYTTEHSPYCGITGTRLFPRDYSMTPDDVGSRDYIAVVVSKSPIDFNQFNARLNAARGATYADKLKEALGRQRNRDAQFQAGETIAFTSDVAQGEAVGVVIEIDK
jgi:hypothetical protein